MFPYETDLIVSPEPQFSQNRIRLLVIGSPGVGKTSLIRRLVGNVFEENLEKSDKFEKSRLHTVARAAEGTAYRLELQEADTTILNAPRVTETDTPVIHDRVPWYDTHAILFLYDVTADESYEDLIRQLPVLHKRASPDCDICLVGCKADMKGERQVHYRRAEKDAEMRDLSLMEVSSKDGTNIDLLFDEVMNYVIEKREAQAEYRKQLQEKEVVYDTEPEEVYRDPIAPLEPVAAPSIFCFWPFRR